MNRYDSPAQDRYFNTYVDLPYEQIMGTVAARQGQLDKAQDALTNMYADTQNLQYIPGSKDEEFVRNYVTGVSDLVGKYYMQDMTDPVVVNQLRSEFNKMTNRQALQNIQMSRAAWDATNKVRTALQAEGTYDPLLDEDPAEGWDTVGSGKVYNYNVSPYKNPGPTADTYFKDLKPGDLGNRGDYWYEGIDKKRIDEVVDAKWGSFADTIEGRQYVKKMAKQSGQDPNDPVVREKIAKEYLRGVGYSQWTWENRGGVLPETSRSGSKDKEQEIDPFSTPLRNLHGAEVNQFEKINKLDDAINKFLSSDKPSDQAKGYDLQINKETASVISPELAKERDSIINSMRQELVNTGKFKSIENTKSFDNILNAYMEAKANKGKIKKNKEYTDKLSYEETKALEQLNTAIDANKLLNLAKDTPTILTNALSSVKNTKETAVALLTKISNPVKYRNVTVKELADSFGTKDPKYKYPSDIDKDNIFDVISKYTTKVNRFNKLIDEERTTNILNKTATIDSKAYSYGFPYYQSSNLSQTVNPATSEKLGVFDLSFISKDVLESPSNYQILEIDGEPIKELKDKQIKGIQTRMNTEDLDDVRIDVLPDSKHGYAPVVELMYTSKNQGSTERHKIKTVLSDPTQRKILFEALVNRGDIEAAVAVSQPQIAQEVSENKFEIGKDYKYRLNTSDGSYTVAIRRSQEDPSSFELIYPDVRKEGEISITKANNRQTLLGLLYKLVSINNAEFILE